MLDYRALFLGFYNINFVFLPIFSPMTLSLSLSLLPPFDRCSSSGKDKYSATTVEQRP